MKVADVLSECYECIDIGVDCLVEETFPSCIDKNNERTGAHSESVNYISTSEYAFRF